MAVRPSGGEEARRLGFLAEVLESAPLPFAAALPDGRLIAVNRAFSELTGYDREELLGGIRWSEDLTPPEERRAERERLQALAAAGEAACYEKECLRKGGARVPVEVVAHARCDGNGSLVHCFYAGDISERRRSAAVAGRAEALARALGSINQVIHSTLDVDEMMRRVVSEAARAFGAETAAISLRRDGRWVVSHVHGFPRSVVGSRMDDDRERHAVLAIETGKPVAISDAYNDERVNREHMRQWGVRSVLVVPLIVRDEVVGVLFLNHHERIYDFTDLHLDFAAKVADSLSLAMENARLVGDLEAELVQRRRAEAEREQLLAEVSAARAEAERRAAELETALETVSHPMAIYDSDGNPVRMNRAMNELLSYTDEELTLPLAERHRLWQAETWLGEPLAAEGNPVLLSLRREAPVTIPHRLREGEGPWRWFIQMTAPIRDGDGAVSGVVASVVEVTELHRAQERLEEERQRLAITLRSIGDGVIATDALGRVVLMNPAAETMTGWSEAEAAGMPLEVVFAIYSDRTGERAESPVRCVIEKGQLQGPANHTVLVSRDGSRRLLADSAAPIVGDGSAPVGVVLVFQDVTERHVLEEERAKVNKLESLGVLAGGIAHDFNNLLTGILGNLLLAKLEAEGQAELEALLSEAERAATRAKGLTQQLLTFARGGEPVTRALALPELITEAASFALRGTLTTLGFHFPAELWPVEADAGQLAQVIQNLAINANEAMPRGGTVTFSAANVTLAAEDSLPVPPGRYVRISIVDEGAGIPREIQARIFDPYFTTKPRGSGLGLSVVYSIAVKHGGYVTVESEPGRGSRFDLYVPAAESADAGPESGRACAGGRGRLLVMDDEDIVLRVARKMLERLGCEVEMAREGGEAVALYARALEEGRPFDAVILDLYVPAGLGGLETLEELRRIDPRVRGVVSSGYSTDPAMARYGDFGFLAAIGKPYSLERLAEVLAAVVPG